MHFIIPFGKVGPPYLGKATAAAPSPTLVHAGSFRVFVTPPNSDMTTGSLTCVRIRGHSYACVHTRGSGTPTASQHNIFDSETLSVQFFLVLLTQAGFEPPVPDLEPDALPTEPPLHPKITVR